MKNDLYNGYVLLIKEMYNDIKHGIARLVIRDGVSKLGRKLRVQHIIFNILLLLNPVITLNFTDGRFLPCIYIFIAFVGFAMLVVTNEICDDIEKLILERDKDE